LRENGKEIAALIRYGEELPCSSHSGEEGNVRGETDAWGLAGGEKKGVWPGRQRKGEG